METNYSNKLHQKFESDFFSEDEFEQDDLEQIEIPLADNISEQKVDLDFLNKVNTVIDNNKILNKLMDDTVKETFKEHPLDTHLKKLILDVMVKDFLPLLEQRILILSKKTKYE